MKEGNGVGVMKNWSNGVLEHWNNVCGQNSITPFFQGLRNISYSFIVKDYSR
ncbi:MAG: hypothetical protein ACYDA4_15850 [Ignavibacteriaceae bacterium]